MIREVMPAEVFIDQQMPGVDAEKFASIQGHAGGIEAMIARPGVTLADCTHYQGLDEAGKQRMDELYEPILQNQNQGLSALEILAARGIKKPENKPSPSLAKSDKSKAPDVTKAVETAKPETAHVIAQLALAEAAVIEPPNLKLDMLEKSSLQRPPKAASESNKLRNERPLDRDARPTQIERLVAASNAERASAIRQQQPDEDVHPYIPLVETIRRTGIGQDLPDLPAVGLPVIDASLRLSISLDVARDALQDTTNIESVGESSEELIIDREQEVYRAPESASEAYSDPQTVAAELDAMEINEADVDLDNARLLVETAFAEILGLTLPDQEPVPGLKVADETEINHDYNPELETEITSSPEAPTSILYEELRRYVAELEPAQVEGVMETLEVLAEAIVAYQDVHAAITPELTNNVAEDSDTMADTEAEVAEIDHQLQTSETQEIILAEKRQAVELLVTELLATLGVPIEHDTVEQFVQRILERSPGPPETNPYQTLSIDQLNFLGTHEYKPEPRAKRLLYLLQLAERPLAHLGRQAVFSSLAA